MRRSAVQEFQLIDKRVPSVAVHNSAVNVVDSHTSDTAVSVSISRKSFKILHLGQHVVTTSTIHLSRSQ